jgi:VWFA-related protein
MILGESDVGRSLLIVFSDGLDTSSWLTADDVLDIARRSDVVVYGVSVGARPKKGFLYDLCSTTGGSLVEADSTKDVGAIFLRVLDEFRHRYLVSYSPRGVVREGWHRIDVRVRRPNTKVQARPGYSQ